MKVREKQYGKIDNIFAIYWGVGINAGVDGRYTNFLGLPEGHGGLLSYNISEVDIMDDSLNGEWMYFSNENIQGIFYAPLIREGLLEGLIDHDSIAYQKFVQIAKKDGLLECDKPLHRCRVCGLLQRDFPWGKDENEPTYKFCYCCGVAFGVEDTTLADIRVYRGNWISSGYQWNKIEKKPDIWDGDEQMLDIPFKYR